MIVAVRPLVAVRRAAPFDPDFLEGSGLFWPLRRAGDALGRSEDFPTVQALNRVFQRDAPVRFVPAAPRRRRGHAVDLRQLYDARVTLDGEVPTRRNCWHDFMNALVWGTFPRAKRALHARQHRAIARRVAPGDRTLPTHRSRELDALALLDEGGVAVLARHPEQMRLQLRMPGKGALRSHIASGNAHAVVFGHAIYESLALGVTPAVVGAVVLEHDPAEADVVRAADGRLMQAIEDVATLRSPTELVRVDLGEAEFASRGTGPERPWGT
ncbi:MAG: DUF3025 domain-containing protein [Polyangiaceae bacterium]|jgi:hypothetical protein